MNDREELAELIWDDEACDWRQDGPNETADAILAAGYRKLRPKWAETLTNDGAFEYTISSDCDGSNVKHWRRIPGMTSEAQPAPWETYEPEPQP